jgi:hypothetical protein
MERRNIEMETSLDLGFSMRMIKKEVPDREGVEGDIESPGRRLQLQGLEGELERNRVDCVSRRRSQSHVFLLKEDDTLGHI